MRKKDVDALALELRQELAYIRSNTLEPQRLGRYIGWRGAVLAVSYVIRDALPGYDLERFMVATGMRDQETSDAIYSGRA